MSSFWNCIDIPPPALISMRFTNENPYQVVNNLKSEIANCTRIVTHYSQLNLEGAVLSRLIYRMKQKFRQEKSFKSIQMINRCLTNYKTIHLPFVLTSMRDTLCEDSGPSRQMLEWALVRFYGTVRLFLRIISLCTDAATHLMIKLKQGTMWDVHVFTLAIVGRIWAMAHFVARQTSDWYSRLFPFLQQLPSSACAWLPENYILPQNLSHLLNDTSEQRHEVVKNPTDILQNLDNHLTESQKTELNKRFCSIMDMDLDDVGESVQRTDQEISLPDPARKNKKINKAEAKHKTKDKTCTGSSINTESRGPHEKTKKSTSFEDISSSEDLLRFLKFENSCQNKRTQENSNLPGKKQVLKQVDVLQWTIIKKFIYKQVKLLKRSEESNDLESKKKILSKVHKYIKHLSSYV